MGWQESKDRWLDGRIQGTESWDDLENWILSDDVWNKADNISWGGKGSKEVAIYVRMISQVEPSVRNDRFQASKSGGNKVKKWQIEILVKIYEQLRGM